MQARRAVPYTLILLSALWNAVAPGRALAQWQKNGIPAVPGLYLQSAPLAVPDGAGGVIVAWGESYYHQGMFAQRIDGTGHAVWSAAGTQIAPSYQGDLSPAHDFALLSDGAGGAWVAYETGFLGAQDLAARHLLASGALDPAWPAGGVTLSAAALDQVNPLLVPDGAGGFIAAWMDGRSGLPFSNMYDLYAQRVAPNGSVLWAADGVPAALTTGRQEAPQMITDGGHGAILTWQDNSMRVYAQRIDSTGARAWPLPAVVLCDSTLGGSRYLPTLVGDGAGGAIVAWGGDDRPATPNGDTYAQRVDHLGAVKWTANGVDAVAGGFDKSMPRLSSDGAGGAFLAWSDQRNGTSYDVFVKRVTGAGATAAGWGASGLLAGHARGTQAPVAISPDGLGGALVTWDDSQTNLAPADSLANVYAQRVTPGGAVAAGWPAGGLAVCNAVENQRWPAVFGDGAGGGYVAWQDQRLHLSYPTDTYSLVYVARLGAGGGLVAVGDGPPPGAAGLSVRLAANPARGALEATLVAPRAGRVEAALYDLGGRLCERHVVEAAANAPLRLTFDPGRALRSGVYFLRLSQGDRSVRTRVCLLR